MYCNIVNDNEFGVYKTFKIEIQKGDQINQSFCKTGFPLEIKSHLFNFYTFEDSEESTPESSRIHWNLMNDKEFGSRKLLKLK